MSSATDDPSTPPPAVLIYKKGAAPAIPVAGQPTADELAFDWTLSPQDLRQVWVHRGPTNQLRFAIHLCVLRKHGRFLTDYGRIPPAVVGY